MINDLILSAVILLVFSLALITLDSYEDYFYIKKNNRWHTVDAITRTIVICFVCLVLTKNLFHSFFFTAIILIMYWILFDIILNNKLNMKWYYVGNTAKMDLFLYNMKHEISKEFKKDKKVSEFFFKYIPFIFKISVLIQVIIIYWTLILFIDADIFNISNMLEYLNISISNILEYLNISISNILEYLNITYDNKI